MKIKKIAAQCKAEGRARLIDYTDNDGCPHQWITNGCAAWPVNGVPLLSPEHLPTMFELTSKQADEMQIQQMDAPEGVNFSDYSNSDIMAREATLRIIKNGEELMPLTAHGVTYFINTAYLTPIWAEYDSDQLTYYLRKTESSGTPYFAVISGLLLVGLVWPMEDMWRLADEMEKLALATPPGPKE